MPSNETDILVKSVIGPERIMATDFALEKVGERVERPVKKVITLPVYMGVHHIEGDSDARGVERRSHQ